MDHAWGPLWPLTRKTTRITWGTLFLKGLKSVTIHIPYTVFKTEDQFNEMTIKMTKEELERECTKNYAIEKRESGKGS